jgi:thioredoxin-like negative regulator of GroEL
MITQIDASQFNEQVTTSPVPVLVEFFSDHCFHCQQLLPILAEIAAERPDALRIFKFNAGDDPRFASQFRIASVPNLVLFQTGGPIAQRSGFSPKRDLLAWIDAAVGTSGSRRS